MSRAARGRSSRAPACAAGLALLLASCVVQTVHTSELTRMEQHLLSVAVERAVSAIPLDHLRDGPVQLEVASLVEGTQAYVESALRARLLREGIAVAEGTTVAVPKETSDTTPEAKPDAAPDVKPDAKRDAKPDAAPDVKSDAKRDVKPSRVLHILVRTAAVETKSLGVKIPFPIPVAAEAVGLELYERTTERGDVTIEGYVVDAATSRLLGAFPARSDGAHFREILFLFVLGPFRESDLSPAEQPPPSFLRGGTPSRPKAGAEPP